MNLTQKQKERVARNAFQHAVKALHLEDYKWRIDFLFHKEKLGEAAFDHEQKTARINVSLEGHDNIRDICDTVLHELVHIKNSRLLNTACMLAEDDDFKMRVAKSSDEEVVNDWVRCLMPLLFDFVKPVPKKPARKRKK